MLGEAGVHKLERPQVHTPSHAEQRLAHRHDLVRAGQVLDHAAAVLARRLPRREVLARVRVRVLLLPPHGLRRVEGVVPGLEDVALGAVAAAWLALGPAAHAVEVAVGGEAVVVIVVLVAEVRGVVGLARVAAALDAVVVVVAGKNDDIVVTGLAEMVIRFGLARRTARKSRKHHHFT